jgi:hypothetical protein
MSWPLAAAVPVVGASRPILIGPLAPAPPPGAAHPTSNANATSTTICARRMANLLLEKIYFLGLNPGW